MKQLEKGSGKVIVAVKAEKTVSKAALAWALTHVAHPGDCITLLAVLSTIKPSKRSFWSFKKLAVDQEKLPACASRISESCSQMVFELQDQIQVQVQIKVVSCAPTGVVAAEAKNSAASWVILDKNLKQEQKHCLEELQCNIVEMKGSKPVILRLHLCSDELQTAFYSVDSSPNLYIDNTPYQSMKHSTPVSSPKKISISSKKPTQESLISSTDTVTSPYLLYENNPLFEGQNRGNCSLSNDQKGYHDLCNRQKLSTSSDHKTVFYITQNHLTSEKSTRKNYQNMRNRSSSAVQIHERNYVQSLSLRNVMSLRANTSIPPSLCPLCKHKSPVFGKPPERLDYEELYEATNGFSNVNLLAKGEFGKVYKGVLSDGQVVAVKHLKFFGDQRDYDFCREVRILSYAQHRNVVLLIGFCVKGRNRFLVYEYICNGSLDFHLHGKNRISLDWQCRQKIAIGAARGLRYLHEDCRVGCITHRDMTPSNILLTHDHEPLLAGFGLARLHDDSDVYNERGFGTKSYIAPEYFNNAKITEKVDIYAFGLVLLELITGRNTTDLQLEPAQVLVDLYQLLDPCLVPWEFPKLPPEVETMSHVAFLCLQQDPDSRPPMSKVLRILEGADASIVLCLDLNTVGSRSGHMKGLRSNTPLQPRRHSRNFSH